MNRSQIVSDNDNDESLTVNVRDVSIKDNSINIDRSYVSPKKA
jgi:hypothetical protein